jgi:HlyD family secretion protein
MLDVRGGTEVAIEPESGAARAGRADAAAIAEILGRPAIETTVDARPRRAWPWRILLVALGVAAAIPAWPWIRERIGRGSATDPYADIPTHLVQRGDLVISVTEDGSLVSDENVDIVCGIAGGATIVWLVEDGARVREGDELVRLDSSVLAESVTAQRIAYEKARAAMIQAEKDHAAAVIAVEEYSEGTYKKDLRKAESDVTAATERLQATRNTLAYGERMFRKGYITPQQLEAQKSAVDRAELDLGTMRIALDVLTRFTRPKMVTELESVRDAAEARRDSERASLELEKSKLERLTSQLEKCVMTAPKDGLVIYANDRNRDRESEVREGAKVTEGKTILRLPDLAKMRVDVEVHEAKVDRIRPGMKAMINVQGRSFTGEVTAVANRPQTSWFSTTKKYLVEVRIDGNTEDLRPGFTAEAEIIVADLHDIIAVPVAAVIQQGEEYVCAVHRAAAGLSNADGGVERRVVTLGQGNDRLVEILSGLEAGETLLLNPRAALPSPAVAGRPTAAAAPAPAGA